MGEIAVDIEKLIKYIRDPRRTEDDLRKLMHRFVKERDIDAAKAVDRELRARFPLGGRDGRAKPVIAMFKGVERIFEKSKDGYVWMLEMFCSHHSEIFTEKEGWRRGFVSDSREIKFISDQISELFPNSPELMKRKCNYVRLSNGLYARTHMDNDQKLKVLCKLAVACNMTILEDWSWQKLV